MLIRSPCRVGVNGERRVVIIDVVVEFADGSIANDDDIEALLANAGFSRENGVWTLTREAGPSMEDFQ